MDKLLKMEHCKKSSLSIKGMFCIVLIIITMLIFSVSFISPRSFTDMVYARLNHSVGIFGRLSSQEQCPGVLIHMLGGRWKTRPLNKTETDDITAFLTNSQVRYRFPKNYQRNDGLCGNVTHVGSAMATNFRALCDPKGATPCCYHNHCTKKSVEECVCKDCYDMRQMKHAEYSTWIPSYPACSYKEHTPQEACDILNGTTFSFVGDSFIRHVYTAMLLVVTGNMKYGALQQNAKHATRKMCEGMYMFTEKTCRSRLNYNSIICNRTANMKMHYYYNARSGHKLKGLVVASKEKSIILTGIGIHNNLNTAVVQTRFLLPSLNYMKSHNKTWPRFVWATHHAPGLLKSPKFWKQSYDNVRKYNTKMKTFLRSWKIPIFDTFNLTDGMMSFDGGHYGRGMNLVKANILLSYIREMREKQLW